MPAHEGLEGSFITSVNETHQELTIGPVTAVSTQRRFPNALD
jgi:hypothetical protein